MTKVANVMFHVNPEDISNETLKAVVFTQLVKEYHITEEDIPMLTKIVQVVNAPIKIERAHYEEDLETLTDGEESK